MENEMETLTVINDRHLGVVRSGGTTQQSAMQLREYLQEGFKRDVRSVPGHLMILGDLFDSSSAPLVDVIQVYTTLDAFMQTPNRMLYLVPGNHDLSKNSSEFSSFQFLANLLILAWGVTGRIQYIAEGTLTPFGYVIPHVENQDLFDMEMANVPECDNLFVHCNYNNPFAVGKDHSLNMSEEQAVAAPVKHIFFAHEHQEKYALDNKVVIIGNQQPSSVADCLGNDKKHYVTIPLGCGFGCWESHVTWQAKGSFTEQDWRSLEDDGLFIRVVGEATAEEAPAVLTAIARLRQKSSAFVITNAVKIGDSSVAEGIALSQERIKAFDVRKAVLEQLTPEEQAKITSLESKP